MKIIILSYCQQFHSGLIPSEKLSQL
uniref:Uncharacterized protein n=1 Tax=Anguilla anguilla TaxID=7936 RepID=A0A0E9UVD5_ANGAN